MKLLNIIESAYRATLEEQDDTILWICGAMKGAEADLDVLLRGNAVNYAAKSQDASGLTFGAWKQTQPPQIAEDVSKLMDKGVKVFVLEEDCAERGLKKGEMLGNVESVKRGDVANLLGQYDRVWHW